jgi:putative spermidine/putrescine transport system permease protein
MIFLVMCPLWVNLVVRTLGLMVILNRDGPINQLLVGLGLFSHPVQLLFNEFAVWIGMVQVSVPFVVLSIYGVLKAIPKELEQSAMTVGANPIRAFMRVTLPLSAPGIGAGTVLALGLNMESFVVPVLLGGGRVHFMSIEAYETATVGNNMPFAATIGLLLLVVTLAILFAYQRLMGSVGRTHASITSS